MLNWFDLMRQAQASAGFDLLTRQFRLSDDQAAKAMLAFLPAFAMGLQHLMLTAPSNPLLQSLTGPASGNPWQAMGQAFTSQVFSAQAQQNGKRVIDSLFGSDEASRRIAHQAADFAGLNVDLMQQMLPLMAGILAGSLHGMMTGQGRMAEMFSPPAKEPEKAAPSEPWTALWTGWAQAFQADEGGAGSLRKPSRSSPNEDPSPKADALPPWQGMMQQGHEMQMQYLASLRTILDEAWKPRGSGR
jgi:Uncharacterized conserved protein